MLFSPPFRYWRLCESLHFPFFFYFISTRKNLISLISVFNWQLSVVPEILKASKKPHWAFSQKQSSVKKTLFTLLFFSLEEKKPPWSRAQQCTLCTENYQSEKATGDEKQISHLEPPVGDQLLQPARRIFSKGRGREQRSPARYSPVPQHPLSWQEQGWWQGGRRMNVHAQMHQESTWV